MIVSATAGEAAPRTAARSANDRAHGRIATPIRALWRNDRGDSRWACEGYTPVTAGRQRTAVEAHSSSSLAAGLEPVGEDPVAQWVATRVDVPAGRRVVFPAQPAKKPSEARM